MAVYYVYRSPYIGPSGKYVRAFDAPTLLDWFRQIWPRAMAATEPREWVEEHFGPHGPQGFHTLFSMVTQLGLEPPADTGQLHEYLEEYLNPGGRMVFDPHALQVLTNDQEVQLAYYLFDDEFAREHRTEAAYLLQDWPLPQETDEVILLYVPGLPVTSIEPSARGEGRLFLLFLGFYDSCGLDDLPGPYMLDGVRLPSFDRWLAKTKDSPAWPVELRLLRAAAGLSRGKDDPLGMALERLRAVPLMCLGGEESTQMTGRQLTAWLKEIESEAGSGTAGPQAVFRSENLLLLGQYAGPGADAGSHLFHQWILFDDVWAAAHPLLADSLLRYASRWDVLVESDSEDDLEDSDPAGLDTEKIADLAEQLARALADEAAGIPEDDDPSGQERLAEAWKLDALAFYDRLCALAADAEYPRVLRFAQAIESIQEEAGEWVIPAHELAFRQAGALANMGDMPAALGKVAHYELDNEMPASVFWGRMAAVYEADGNYERGLACKKRAVELDPGNGMLNIDLADSLIHHFGDVAAARQAIAAAERHGIPPLATCYLEPVMGTIALLEGHISEALDLYDGALQTAIALVPQITPLLTGHVRMVRGYRAVALARAGRTGQARRELADLRAFLERARCALLIRRIEAAIASEPEPLIPRR